MSDSLPFLIDPQLDLFFERVVDLPADRIWTAWTTPEHLLPWFCPKPWKTISCEIDLRPGGRFTSVMQSPEGQEFPNTGCYLEIVENRRLVWTNAMLPGFRPVQPRTEGDMEFLFTAAVMLEPRGTHTRYSALAMHTDEASRKKHEAMGFEQGWGTCLDQLVAYMKGIAG